MPNQEINNDKICKHNRKREMVGTKLGFPMEPRANKKVVLQFKVPKNLWNLIQAFSTLSLRLYSPMEKISSEQQLADIVQKLMFQGMRDYLASRSFNDNTWKDQMITQEVSIFHKEDQCLPLSTTKKLSEVELEYLENKMLFSIGSNLIEEIAIEEEFWVSNNLSGSQSERSPGSLQQKQQELREQEDSTRSWNAQ